MPKPKQLDFSKLPGTSNLFLDFVSGKATDLYHHHFQREESYRELQDELLRRQFDRLSLVSVLRKQNESYAASEKTFGNIEKLGRPETLAVVTGQQVTLFGGSILSYYKAAVAVKLAETNCRKLHTDVVPVFWMAADDADFKEVAHLRLPTPEGEVRELAYQPERDVTGLPMSHIKLDDSISTLLNDYTSALPNREYKDELAAGLKEIYAPGQSIVRAFARYLSWIFRDRGLIIVDPSDPELRRLAKPIFLAEARMCNESNNAIAGQNDRLQASGYHLQVTRPEEYTNLFYDNGLRMRIDRYQEGFRAGEEQFTADEFENLIDQNPERFSANVFLRPIVQSYLFPTLVHFVGPAEVAYIAQIKNLYNLFATTAPVIYPRFSATIIEAKVKRVLEKHELHVSDFVNGADSLISHVMKQRFPDPLEDDFSEVRADIRKRLDTLVSKLDQSDEGLMTTAKKSIGKVDFEIKGLQQKVFQAHRKKNKTVRNQLERAAFNLFPEGNLQEKVFPLNYYIATFGPKIIDLIYEKVDCNTSVHHLIDMKES